MRGSVRLLGVLVRLAAVLLRLLRVMARSFVIASLMVSRGVGVVPG